jgi:tetratricopeptide (TPR) repeat protein
MQKKCFVVMGFGKKTDFPSGRTLDLDKSYRVLIKPAVVNAGLECVRADEIVHAGSIDWAMYRELLEADAVVADISTCNPNALYELGVRHALRPFTTVTIAEEQLINPFDVSHTVIRRYQHLGTAIDAEEADRFRNELTDALKTLLALAEPDSPVYTFLRGLKPPVLEVLEQAAGEGDERTADARTLSDLTVAAEAAMAAEDFETAKDRFAAARELHLDDYLTQRLALATYKSKVPTAVAALQRAKAILTELNPSVSNDPETLGLWGAVHKRLWEATSERAHLDTAILAYERGFDIRNDYYNGINLAFLLNVRAELSAPAERIADFIDAERVRRRVIPLCDNLLTSGLAAEDERYWVAATLAEAFLGIGDEASSDAWLDEARRLSADTWKRTTTAEQLEKLRSLLEPSPLSWIRPPESV